MLLETVGWSATFVALVGVYLNNRRRRACFVVWLISNAMTLGIHVAIGMWSLAARDVSFFVLAIHGWMLWGRNAESEADHEGN